MTTYDWMADDEMEDSEVIQDDIDLLNRMLLDARDYSGIYQPGPYWLSKTSSAVKEIRKFGLINFRGCENSAATSYGDNALIDTRYFYNHGIRRLLGNLYRNIYPFNRLFDSQVRLTRSYFHESIKLRTELYKNKKRVLDLIRKYKVPSNNCKGGCLSYGVFDGVEISHYYLQMIDTLDVIANEIDLSSMNSFFEIGGGFGVNTHILIENYPNIRKVIYLDIPPNLYVGTQYLRSFYGSRVIAYNVTRALKEISFAPNDELEIFCITPAQIERLNCNIDYFHNAHSFVEMPKAVVLNYAKHIERLLAEDGGAIALVSYDCFNLESTFHPDLLESFFSFSFTRIIDETLSSERSNYYYIAA